METLGSKTYHAAVYLRLSREDGDAAGGGKAVSESISNQRELVMDYLKSRADIRVLSVYVDDGWSGVVKDVGVKLSLVRDSVIRKHVQLEITCTYDTPFGEGLELFGMEGVHTYTVAAALDCTDILDYYSTTGFAKTLRDGSYVGNSGFVVLPEIKLRDGGQPKIECL